ncbi:MAG: rod shape-determining protein RodA [Gammaproteobacteria bacterium]|nr:MAG: rod shape-determining protein RodA [Gammaproteobacteria bacterium]
MTTLLNGSRPPRLTATARLLGRLHLDGMLLAGILAIMALGLLVLYSAVGQSEALVLRQAIRLLVALAAMLLVAQLPPAWYRRLAPWLYLAGLLLLALVLYTGDIGKGARRWLDIGLRFQPSEIMKLALPMMLAWLLHERPLPPSFGTILLCLALTLLPVAMIALQPDLGTAILITLAGAAVIFLAGIGAAYLFSAIGVALVSLPALWYFVMHDYQKSRVLTLLDPDRDPLGAGYHIIQSKIAIGSGGLFGKGWLNGSQAQLEFLPERSTDFIFAVIGEEFGLLGALSVLLIYLLIVSRGLFIAATAQDTFSRLLAGSISLTFFFYVFVNTAMVIGLLPVVGVPLPLISAGGTSMVTLLTGFGILMSIQTHRKLLAR